uniref:ARC6 IMS domain-containing protein n=1 Tax=Musa acuminata subsp. malaccensis TaxID=214687 RepID=A0A804IC65_MUSAM|nr:PREDICTED: plastid division protein CDP1, chloroplastic-like isoform X1 [Musa acuminata subsp. malaccensis]XP_018679197.1 PREDICTED: plastid division protein CDP1, chloroplastic-like isoform X1 [Musa acuminata subsp. malaccensis]
MASSRAVLGLPVKWRTFGNGALVDRRRVFALGDVASSFARDGERKLLGHLALVAKSHSSRGEISGQAKLRVLEAPAVENWQILSGVEIPVTCFQLLGVTAQSEKDEIAKVVMELKSSVIEDGYTAGTIVSRQGLLIDVRDKLLFEPEYAGNIKEKVPPKSSLRIPWSWLPGALCLLKEVGEDKMVLEIGQAALQLADAKPYSHDLLLSMTLAECSIAKIGFENNKISEGFEALAYARYLLRSHISLGKMPLLSQIEESLEDLAPACTLELLGLPHVPDNAECRRGALAALQELIRQGLDVEFSCRVQDWPCFLIQAMNKLMASEIVDLLSWDSLAIRRKNKKSIESQNQRIVLDFNCFYLAMIAHIALGFSTRQNEMISRAKTICECLIVSEGAELKFEEAFCSFLLGQGGGMEAVEKLQQLEAIRSSTSRNSLSSLSGMDKDKVVVNQALETWLKDAALSLFLDTHDCSPSMANFFGSPMRILSVGKQKIGTTKSLPSAGNRISNFGLLPDHGTSVAQAAHDNLTNHLDKAFKHLLSVNLQRQMSVGDPTGNISLPSSQLKRNIDFHSKRFWESWFSKGNMAGKIAHTALVGWIVFGAFKLLAMRSGNSKMPYELKTSHPCSTSQITASSHHGSCDSASAFVKRDLMGQLRKFWAIFRGDLKYTNGVGSLQNTWPTDDLSRFSAVAAGTQVHRRQMSIEEAEALVKQWQDIKAEALGPSHQIQLLPNILSESILLKWEELANSAKARSCFWKFVLLQTSILHAKIVSDGGDDEMAEIEAVLEEAAELVDDSEPRKPNYYSTYEVHYILRRQEDGSWRFCGGGIQNQNMT